jgi:predicted anti-sigma-YlaC factor YlaD
MTCSECEENLQRFLDGDGCLDSPVLEEHCAICRECRERHAAAMELARGLRVLAYPTPPPELTERLVAALTAEGERRFRPLPARAALVALAASVALAVAGANLWRGRPSEHVPDASRLVSATPRGNAVSLQQTVSDASSAFSSLVEMTAQETLAQGQLLLPNSVPVPALARVETLQQSLEPPVESLRQAGQNLSTGLEPIASSAQRAFLTFVDDLAPMGSQ